MRYRVEALAAAAGVRVDTIRFYQSKGLLPPPQRVRREARYSDEHLGLLKRIRRYQSQGLSLALIKRLLSDAKRNRGDALLAAVAEQSGDRLFTQAELAAQSGIPEPLLTSLESAGLLQPTLVEGEARYGESDLQLLQAGLAILQEGFPLDELLRTAMRHAKQVTAAADAGVDLFDRYVRKSKVGGDAVAETFRRLLPAVTTLVALHFQRTLLQRALERLRERGDTPALETAESVLRSGRLEVRWR